MSLLLVSDLHLNPHSTDRNQQFLEFLSHASREADSIIIVGDLFDLWFGWENLRFDFQTPILLKMRELYDAGLSIRYVEGNRDFGISKHHRVLFEAVSSKGVEIKYGGWNLYIEHGDLINKEDLPYRTFRRLTKNAFTFFLIDHLPSSFLLKLAEKLEKKLKGTNLRYKSYYPEEQIKEFCDGHFHRGTDIVVVGHFHQEREHVSVSGSRSVLFFNLPGWEDGFRYLVIPEKPNRPYFQNWKEDGNTAKA